jgi:uncharacterized protein (TIGR02599 family)
MNSTFTQFIKHPPVRRGFTLVELLLTMVIVSIIMMVLVEAIGQTESVWWREQARVSEFQEARGAMESMSRRLAEATLDSCWVYKKDQAGRDTYARAADGHFVSGPASELLGRNELHGHGVFFQAPFGHTGESAGTNAPAAQLERMDELLNCVGYYVDYQSDLPARPSFLAVGGQLMTNPERKRFCLVEFRQPAEEMTLFTKALGLNNPSTMREQGFTWFRGPFSNGRKAADYSRVVAENILALILDPEWLDTNVPRHITTSRPVDDCYYDTREVQWGGVSKKAEATQHQLPPTVRMTLISTEEKAYQQLERERGEGGAADAVRAVFTGRFTNHASREADLLAVERGLTGLQLNHRIFSTHIALRGSKWIVEKRL